MIFRVISRNKSLDIGCVTLTDRVGQDQNKAKDYANKRVKEYCIACQTDYYAIGGTATSVASMLLNLKVYDTKQVDGFVINYKSLIDLKEKLYLLSVEDRKNIVGLQPQRAEVIASGVSILSAIMEYLRITKITVSESDNLEGYLMLKRGKNE